MAYQTGTASDVNDLINQLRTFAQNLGWTINYHDVRLASYTGKTTADRWLSIYHLDAGYFNVYSHTTNKEIYVNGATGYAGGSTEYAQTGQGWVARANGLTGPFTAYHFFGTTQYLHVVIETSAGIFSHFNIGKLNKTGNFVGGEYAQAVDWCYYNNYNVISSPDSYHMFPFCRLGDRSYCAAYCGGFRADIDGRTNNWFSTTNSYAYAYPGATSVYVNDSTSDLRARGSVRNNDSNFGSNPSHLLFLRSPNAFNGLTPLIPLTVGVERLGDNKLSLIGHAPDMRLVNMRNLSPNDVMTIGSDQWIVFPIKQRSDTVSDSNTVPKSGYYGYAYRIVP